MPLSIPQMALMSRLLDEALPLDEAGRRAWLEKLSPEYPDLAQHLREALLPEDSQAAYSKSRSALPKLASPQEASARARERPASGRTRGAVRVDSAPRCRGHGRSVARQACRRRLQTRGGAEASGEQPPAQAISSRVLPESATSWRVSSIPISRVSTMPGSIPTGCRTSRWSTSKASR